MESDRDSTGVEETPPASDTSPKPPEAVPDGASPSEPTAWPRGKIPEWAERYIGKEIGFRYRIVRPLAAGGMGAIFLGQQTNLNRKVAIKLVRSNDPQVTARMQLEAESLAAVNHPAIVEVHDFIVASKAEVGECYLVMGYVPGVDLARYLDKRPRRGLATSEVLSLLTPIASALVELHSRDIIHRDVKPSNMVRFVGADGVVRCKLVDFGFARKRLDPNITSDGIVVGTPAYLAREVIMGAGHSAKSDVYALGVTLFKLLSGQNPHGSSNVGEIVRNAVHHSVSLPATMLGTSLGELTERMLSRNPDKRPDMIDVFKALNLAAAELTGEDDDDAAELPRKEPEEKPADEKGRDRDAPSSLEISAALTAAPSFRVLWVVIGALSIAVAALAVMLIMSMGHGEKSAAPAPAAVPMAAPPARRASPRRAVAPRRASPPDSKLAAIRKRCTDADTMRQMFHHARKVILGQLRGDLEQARLVLEALLTAKCTPSTSRHWVSYYLTMAHIKAGRCEAARKAWQVYRDYQRRTTGKAPSLPRCQ